jgi:hypothetical protein
MTRRLTVAVAALVLSLAALGAPGPVTADTAADPAATTPAGFDNTVFEITVYENGSARWALQHVRILNDSETAFQSYADRFERTETDLYTNFVTRAQRLTAFGTNATGRAMNATNFAREAFVNRVGQRRGVVELSFLWENFATRSGERVVVGDVFEGGLYITGSQRLVVTPGPGVTFADAPRPEPDSVAGGTLSTSESVTWFGERTFADRRPRVELRPVASDAGPGGSESVTPAGTTTSGGGAADDATGGDGGDTGGAMLPLVVMVVVLAGLGGGLAWYAGVLPGRGGSGTTETVTGGDSGGGAAQTAEPAVPEEQLLSDEDRVRKLLEDNGGRMKQVNIVDETEWSKSKVSMLLSEMEENGEISKLRVGRENIISLAGEEPDAAGSPFEEE